jgi:hypothetical protein
MAKVKPATAINLMIVTLPLKSPKAKLPFGGTKARMRGW